MTWSFCRRYRGNRVERPTWPTWIMYSTIERGNCADFLQIVHEHMHPMMETEEQRQGGGGNSGGSAAAAAAAAPGGGGRKASLTARRNSTMKDVQNEFADFQLARRLSQELDLPKVPTSSAVLSGSAPGSAGGQGTMTLLSLCGKKLPEPPVEQLRL